MAYRTLREKISKLFRTQILRQHGGFTLAEEFKISQTMFAMNGGEDYELLMTLPLQSFETLKSIPEISIIGHITEDKNQLDIILENGSVATIEAQGWQHFSNAEKLDQETTDNQ